jgi:hypothetical protein
VPAVPDPVEPRRAAEAFVRERAHRLCFKYLKNSPSVDRMSVVSGAKVLRYVSIVFRNW